MENLKKQIQLAVDAFKSGRILEAEGIAKKLIDLNPKVAFLYNLLGLISVDQKKIDQALEYYQQGIKIDPNYAMIYNNLGILYFRYKSGWNHKEAENFYKKSISLDKKLPEPQNNLGNLYKELNKFEEAMHCYKKAIGNNPKFSYGHYNLANTYVTLGKFDLAKKHFTESIKLDPNFFNAHRSLSRITKYTEKEKHFIELKKLYKKIDINRVENGMDLAFALAKAHEDVENIEKSFEFYKKANFLNRSKINFSLKRQKEKFKSIKTTFDKKLFLKYKDSGCLDTNPIFIVGMPRSGTTLVEQIISSHPKVFAADEVEFIPSLIEKNFGEKNLSVYLHGAADFDKKNLKLIGEEYKSIMKYVSNNSDRFTDKLPTNFLSIGFIKLILPRSKIIHCYRSPRDNCLSIFKNHFTSGKVKFAYDLNEIVEYYNLYEDLMQYWNDLLPNFIFNIKYENLISDTKAQIQSLLKACDLNWVDDCLKFYNNKRPIRTSSDIQARKKIYNTSIDSWKKYEKYLNVYFEKLNN